MLRNLMKSADESFVILYFSSLNKTYLWCRTIFSSDSTRWMSRLWMWWMKFPLTSLCHWRFPDRAISLRRLCRPVVYFLPGSNSERLYSFCNNFAYFDPFCPAESCNILQCRYSLNNSQQRCPVSHDSSYLRTIIKSSQNSATKIGRKP